MPRKRSACRHRNEATKFGETTHDVDGVIVYECEFRECLDCGAWLPLGAANDAPREVAIEIAASRLLAGFFTANDTDDTLDDPIAGEVLEHWVGFGDGPMSDAAEQCWHLHDVAVENGFLDGPEEPS